MGFGLLKERRAGRFGAGFAFRPALEEGLSAERQIGFPVRAKSLAMSTFSRMPSRSIPTGVEGQIATMAHARE